MPASYSPVRAVFSIGKASFLAMLRSPTSIVFSILFPVIFVVVFGSINDVGALTFKLAVAPGCDTANSIFSEIKNIPHLTIKNDAATPEQQTEDLNKARLTAVLDIKKDNVATGPPHYTVNLTSANAASRKVPVLKTYIDEIIGNINKKVFIQNATVADVKQTILPGRAYLQIDFILPGQLGFSLLMAGVFGSAFLLFGLRKGLVLKRLAATPVSRFYIIAGEMFSRLIFQVAGFIIIIALGYYVFNFTLVNGLSTFFEMLAFSLEGLVIFMGIGFIISGLVQNESSIAPVANTVTLPQILLCGLFFPVESYPAWLQWICHKLPLTLLTDGLRKIAFEGIHVWQLPQQLTGLTIWAVVVSIAASKVFKWE